MKQSIRHQKIIQLITQRGYVSTEELVAELAVSSQTIRRDLNELAENNLIRRHHGGAGSPSSSENSDYIDRKHFFSQQKNIIGNRVAEMIPNGASLFLDIGTTAEAIAAALCQKQNLRIVTNNLNAAHLLMHKEDFQITIAGGGLRPDGGIIGEATVNFIDQFRLDYCILGISAVESDGSMMDYDYHEVQVKRALMRNARHIVLATDHSKFSRNAIVRLGNIKEINHLFTNRALPPALQDYLIHSDVNVHICQE
ncbi:transcriptional regulator [Pasteurellaceae bacterium Macca]|nr:transcriptional regulator [Pasteurellaceae bacterium Macca]